MKLTDKNNRLATRLAVCVPCRDTMHSMFSYCLIQLVQWCNSSNQIVSVFMDSGSIISRQRQNLAQTALENGFTHVLWLDSDMTFPPNIGEQLLSHNQPIVACNYSTRTLPQKSVAYTKIGNWDSWLDKTNTSTRLVEVEGVGMGCMVTSINAYKNLSMPWFDVVWHDKFNDFLGEDFYFCEKLRSAGNKILIDTVLSNKIKHIGLAQFDLLRVSNTAINNSNV